MASNVPDACDADLAHLSGAELVRHLRTASRMADYEAVEHVLSARERRAAEAETQLKAEIDAMRKELDARTRALKDEAAEVAAHLATIAAGAEAHLKAALAEIDALRKKHDVPSRVPQDEAGEETPILRTDAPSAVPQDEAEEAALLLLELASSAVLAPAAVPHDETEETPLLGIASSPVLALASVPHDEAEETPLLGIQITSSPVLALATVPHEEAVATPPLGIAAADPAPAPVPQDEQRVVEGDKRYENGVETIELSSDDEEGPRADGSCVSRKSKASADEDDESGGDTIPLIHRLKRLRETMAPPLGFALQISASPMNGKTQQGPSAMSSQLRSASVTASKRVESVEASDTTLKARTDLQDKGKKTRAAGNSPRARKVGGRGRRRTLDKPVPAASHSSFRCWLQLPSSSAPTSLGGNPGDSSTVVAPAVVSLEENRMPSCPPLSIPDISGAVLRNMGNGDNELLQKLDKAVANGHQLQASSFDNGLHVDEVNPTRVRKLGQRQQQGDGNEVALRSLTGCPPPTCPSATDSRK